MVFGSQNAETEARTVLGVFIERIMFQREKKGKWLEVVAEGWLALQVRWQKTRRSTEAEQQKNSGTGDRRQGTLENYPQGEKKLRSVHTLKNSKSSGRSQEALENTEIIRDS